MAALQGRRKRITIDRVLRARGKIMKNKANGPADCLVTEMLQCSPMETAYQVTHSFEKRFSGECRAQEAWTNFTWYFSRSPTPSLKRLARLPDDRAFERIFKVVHDGAGGLAARGEGAD